MSSLKQQASRHVRVARSYLAQHLPRSRGGLGALAGQGHLVLAVLAVAAMLVLLATATPAWAAQEAFAAEAAQKAPAAEAPTADGTEGSEDAEDSEDSEDADDVEAAEAADNTVNARQTADNSFLYDTSIYELTQADASFQGDTVQVVGEVVGDSILAEEDPGKRWITLEAVEDEYESSISVLVDEGVVDLIDTYGAYNRQGTTLQVRGTFYLACPSHEGIIDIHAESVTVLAHGSTSSDEFDLESFIPGFVLCGIGVLLALLYRFLRERER